jgi:NAD(P)H dehydrogenase (quinone)
VNHLIIYANHSHTSFNYAILNKLHSELLKKGADVVIRDLYSMNFQPVLNNIEIKALREGRLSKDVAEEQDFIRWADYIHFIYPIWWTGMPAILKGYIDRVFSYGFAYLSGKHGPIGLLKGKNVLVFNTLGQSREEYKKEMFHALNLTSDEGIFRFCGIEVEGHYYFPSITSVNEKTRKEYMEVVRMAVESICQPQPDQF